MHLLVNELRYKLGLPAKNDEKEQGFRCLNGYYWGFPDGQDELPNGDTILYEIEEGQQHPNTNVLKYWPVIEENRTLKIILVQWLVRPLKSKNRWELSKFVANKMMAAFPDRFRYIFLELDNPDNQMKLEQLKQQIQSVAIS